MSLQSLSILPKNNQTPTGLLVILHGWGANYYDLFSLASELNLPDYAFEFPDAPFPHPDVPGGKMWYDLQSQDYQGLTESRQILLEWLLSLEGKTGIPLSRTILSGFSQGGAMILDVGLTLPLAGLVSMSGYLHFNPQLSDGALPPILMTHGNLDMVVPLAMTIASREGLKGIGASVEYHEFSGGHEIPRTVIQLIHDFVLKTISNAA